MKSRILTWVFACFCISAFSSEVRWVELDTKFSYRDLSVSCQTRPYPFYLGIEIEEGSFKRAVLKEGGFEVFYAGIELTPDEISGIQFTKDASGISRIVKLELSSRLLIWSFQNAGKDFLFGCIPPQPILNVTPQSFTYFFSKEDVSLGERVLISNEGKFSGVRKDGRAYQAQLSFIQKRIRAPGSN